jgi:hypothetical protein
MRRNTHKRPHRTAISTTTAIYQKPRHLRVTNTGYTAKRDYIHHKPTRKPNRINGFKNGEFVDWQKKSKPKIALYAILALLDDKSSWLNSISFRGLGMGFRLGGLIGGSL